LEAIGMGVINVGIIGLGQLGTSVALAVKRYQQAGENRQQFTVTGFDVRGDTLKAAKATGAFDEIAGSLTNAARNKEIVVLALPYADVRDAYSLIAGDLQAGAVVLDFSPLAVPSIGWAQALEKDEAHLVSVTAVLNAAYLFDGRDDPRHAAADLFDKGSLMLSPSATAHPDAVELASDFAVVLGSAPRFVDPYEHDGWMGAVELLPALLGITGFLAARATLGWDDAQRAGNPNFGRLTHALADAHPDDMRELLLQDRDAALRVIDAEMAVLAEFRQALAARDTHGLAEAIEGAFAAYDEWLGRRMLNEWGDRDNNDKARLSPTDAVLSSFLGGYLARKLRGGRQDDE
jgi:prephenate dehydrogenase